MPSYSLSENAPTTPPGSAARVRRHCRSKDLPRSCRCQRIPKVSPLPEHGQEFGSLSGLYQGPHQAVVCRRCRSPEQHAMADGEGSEAEGSRRTEDVQEIGAGARRSKQTTKTNLAERRAYCLKRAHRHLSAVFVGSSGSPRLLFNELPHRFRVLLQVLQVSHHLLRLPLDRCGIKSAATCRAGRFCFATKMTEGVLEVPAAVQAGRLNNDVRRGFPHQMLCK